jgi:hypothetical protein
MSAAVDANTVSVSDHTFKSRLSKSRTVEATKTHEKRRRWTRWWMKRTSITKEEKEEVREKSEGGPEMAVVLAVGHIDGGLVGRRGNRLAKRMA